MCASETNLSVRIDSLGLVNRLHKRLKLAYNKLMSEEDFMHHSMKSHRIPSYLLPLVSNDQGFSAALLFDSSLSKAF